MLKKGENFIFWLLPRHWLMLFTCFMVIIVQVVLNIALARYLGVALDIGLSDEFGGFIAIFIQLLTIWFLGDLALFLRSLLTRYTAESIVCHLRQKYVVKISLVELSSLEQRHSADFTSRLVNDLDIIKEATATHAPSFIQGCMSFAISLVLLLRISWLVTLLTLCTLPVMILFSSILGKEMGKHRLNRQQQLAKLQIVAQDSTVGILVVKSFNLAGLLSERFRIISQNLVKLGCDLAFAQGKMYGAMQMLSILPSLVLFGVGGYRVIQGEMTLGALVTMLNLLNNLTWPMQELSQSLSQIRSGMMAARRITEIIELPEEREGGAALAVDQEAPCAIELKQVYFSYDGEKNMLKDINLKIRPGEKVALVGGSGSGKSTLFAILLGMREITQGEIHFFGQPLDTISLQSLRENIVLATQTPLLYPISIKENILLGKADASESEIREAAELAGVSSFISDLPHGYDTLVGEGGSGVSGGQKQRITLARSLLRNAAITLLDEPTSALDTQTEAAVLTNFLERYQESTMVMITHRLYTLRKVDRIIVLEGGRIIEEGTHVELLEKGGAYAKLLHEPQVSTDNGGVSA